MRDPRRYHATGVVLALNSRPGQRVDEFTKSTSARPSTAAAGRLARRHSAGPRLSRGEVHLAAPDLTQGPPRRLPSGCLKSTPDRGQAYEPPPPCKIVARSAWNQQRSNRGNAGLPP